MPEEIKKEIFELSRLNAIDLNKLAQMKAAKAMEKAAKDLDFMMAAKLRDKIKSLQNQLEKLKQ